MLDPEGCITNWNLGGERIKGYSATDIVGQHFSIFFTAEDRAKGEPGREIATAAREGRFEGEGWRVRKDGTMFWASVVVDRILDHDGNLLGFAKVTRDMTEKKKAEEELERARAALAQAQKMEAIGQLTGGVAHDFNNLLTVITNSLDLILDPRRDETQRRRIIDTAQRAAERGAKLNQQLLAFSRRQPLRPEPHNINALIGGFEAVLRRACREAIEFDLDLAPSPVAATIDAQQFETALLNLVVNARDAMPAGGSLRLATGIETIDEDRARTMSDIAPGRYVKVSVSDTGEGMTPEVVGRAFEPFFTTKEVGKGSGLGLSQVYGFVVQSGGHVAIDSTPGAGTSVTLFLPATDRDPAADPAHPETQTNAVRAKILVVEDDPDVLDVAVESLRMLGYDVLTAPDGPSALAVLRRDPDIQILLSDIAMPHGMNGVELARTAVRLHPKLRVLLASGYPMTALPRGDGPAVLVNSRSSASPIAALSWPRRCADCRGRSALDRRGRRTSGNQSTDHIRAKRPCPPDPPPPDCARHGDPGSGLLSRRALRQVYSHRSLPVHVEGECWAGARRIRAVRANRDATRKGRTFYAGRIHDM